MNFRFFLFVSLIVMLFAINCTSSTNEETAQISNQGILQDTTVMIQKDELQYGTIPQDDRDSCYVKRIVSDACIERKIERLIFSSSVYVYSKSGGVYKSTKQACELLIKDYDRMHDLNYTILQLGLSLIHI